MQRIPTPDGAVENEGNMEVPVEPYQNPYRVLLPKRKEVTVAASATRSSITSGCMDT